MTGEPNPIFKENYGNDLRQLEDLDLSLYESVLGTHVDAAGKSAEIPFFDRLYRFNDADSHFPARALILFERRGEHFLEKQCLVMVCLALHERLKRAEKSAIRSKGA